MRVTRFSWLIAGVAAFVATAGVSGPGAAAAGAEADAPLPKELVDSEWARRCVRPDGGAFRVEMHLHQGDATPADLREIA
ncbi:MAG: hypothetical protein QGG89_12460, partial [Vicinamibacterales bacterium]|nr:hypothetical protein [Vicinamibacterales bacterium]